MSGTDWLNEAKGQDQSEVLLGEVRQAIDRGEPLHIGGGGSKSFLGRQRHEGLPVLDVTSHHGIVSYDPTELIITARAGTRLSDLHAILDLGGQMLACEPPSYGDAATVGGMVAVGMSGPRRPWSGAVRDFVLGVRMVSGLGTLLRFGGEVMKNVAGYDVSRLMVGSYGCLGLITEVSFKVLPKPRCTVSVRLEVSLEQALENLAVWGQQPLPITAACHDGQSLRLRFEGNEGSVQAAKQRIGGEETPAQWWIQLREHQLPFFSPDVDARPLWRISLPSWASPLTLPGEQLVDWGGAQRWLRTDASPKEIRAAAEAAGGHATCFTAGHVDMPFHPLQPTVLRLHRSLKKRMDPHGVFNPGRMYPEF